jgi:uncharacterized membrane protein
MFEEILHILGFGLCHQLPERSFFFGGLQWPVCARCTGIYLGLALALAALFLAYRGAQHRGAPSWPFWVFFGLALLAMAYDGFSSYLGWRPTTNLLRLVTGIAVGGSLAVIIYTMLVGTLAKKSTNETILAAVKPTTYFAVSLLLVFPLVYAAGPVLGPVLAAMDALAIILTFTLLALIIIGLFKRFDRSVSTWRDLAVPSGLALLVGLVLIAAFAALKFWAVGSF